MIRIYDKNTDDFSTNGLGYLIDFKSSPIISEALNGKFELTFDYAIKGKNVEYLTADNIIKAPYDNSEQLFKIKTVTPSLTKISIYATHIFYDLNDNFLSNVAPTNRTGASAVQWLLDHAMYPTKFTASGDNSTVASARYENRNIVEAILGSDNCIVNTWNAEIERDNFNIIINDKRGNDSGVYIKYGKNIKDIKIGIDYTTVVTRIVPIGKNGLKIAEEYVDSPLINTYKSPIVKKQEFSDIGEDEETSNEEAQQNLRDACKKLFSQGIDKPSISVKVDWLELSKIDKYREKYSNFEKVRLGDTVTVQALGYEYKIRVIKVEYDSLLEKFTKFEIGDPKSDFVNNQSSIISKEIEKNNTNILEQARQITTTLINSGFGGYVRIYPDRILIMDTDDESTAQNVWQWNLNGFAHSSTGINGEYTTGITMNGSIVGDMITTGLIKAARVEGLEDLILSIRKTIDILDIATATGKLEMTSNFETRSFELKITNACQLFSSNRLFSSDGLFGKDTWLKITYEDKTYNRYKLPILALRKLGDVYDELNIKSGKVSITTRIGTTSDDELYLLKEEKTTLYDDIPLLLKKGKNIIELESFPEAEFEIKYMITNMYTDLFATKVELDASITLLNDNIKLEIDKKVGPEEVTNMINMALDGIKLEVSKKISEERANELIKDNSEALNTELSDKIKASEDKTKETTDALSEELKGKIDDTKANELIEEKTQGFIDEEKANELIGDKTKNFIDETKANDLIDEKTNPLSENVGKIDAKYQEAVDAINKEMGTKIGEEDFTGAQIILKINGDESEVLISGDKVNLVAEQILNLLAGNAINLTSKDITIASDNWTVDPDGKMILKDKSTLIDDLANLKIVSFDNENSYASHSSMKSMYTYYDESKDISYSNSISQQDISQYYSNNSSFGEIYITPNIDTTADKAPSIILSDGLSHVSNQTSITSKGIRTPTLTQTSLFNKKKNFEKLKEGLSIINETEIYKYHLKSQKDSEKKHIGFVIGKDYKYSKDITSDSNEEVDLYSMIAVAYKAIQEQQLEIDLLKKKIKEMEENKI